MLNVKDYIGIHFDMDEETYFSLPALSASGMKHLRASPLDFWTRSNFNPNLAEVEAEEASSEAKDLGTAFDVRIISGKDAFARRYAEKLEASDHPDYMRTADDLKAWLRERGLPVSGKKEELIERVLEAEPAAPIWDVLEAGYEKEHEGKMFLSAKWMSKIEIAAKMIEADPVLSKAFTGGAPQVSIVWHDDIIGVDMKCRIDYLKARAIVDLKTTENYRGLPLQSHVNREIINRGYHKQMALYDEAVAHVPEFIKNGRVCGEADPSLLRSLSAGHAKTLVIITQVKGVAPTVVARTLPQSGMIIQAAKTEIESLKQTYRHCLETYGPDVPWITPASFQPLQDDDIAPWQLL